MGPSRHARFLLAFALGGAIAIGSLVWAMPGAVRALLAVNGFFLSYLALMLRLALRTSADDLSRHAEADDEGIALILLLALAALAISLTAIFLVLNRPTGGVIELLLALAAVPLGWAMVHTLAGFRYAHLYYARKPDRGLVFAGTPKPGVWEFQYLSFGIGMTAQVADVVVTDSAMRRVVLLHSVGSFFYNTVILALAVNAALAFGG